MGKVGNPFNKKNVILGLSFPSSQSEEDESANLDSAVVILYFNQKTCGLAILWVSINQKSYCEASDLTRQEI